MGYKRPSENYRGRGKQIIWGFAALTAANFIAFLIIAIYLGGDAINGYARAGHYFLGAHSNGPFTEVSHAIFTYSLWHALSVIASGLFFMGVALRQHFRRAQPYLKL
jgi:hypothetical protein